MIDDVQSYVAAAEVLKERGAYKIYVLATHGLLSSDAPRLIEESPIDEVTSSYTFNFSQSRVIYRCNIYTDQNLYILDFYTFLRLL